MNHLTQPTKPPQHNKNTPPIRSALRLSEHQEDPRRKKLLSRHQLVSPTYQLVSPTHRYRHAPQIHVSPSENPRGKLQRKTTINATPNAPAKEHQSSEDHAPHDAPPQTPHEEHAHKTSAQPRQPQSSGIIRKNSTNPGFTTHFIDHSLPNLYTSFQERTLRT